MPGPLDCLEPFMYVTYVRFPLNRHRRLCVCPQKCLEVSLIPLHIGTF